jgi:hypothetical protein
VSGLASWQEVGPARVIGRAIGVAVDAAGGPEAGTYQGAVAELTGLPAEQVGQLLGAIIRTLLEEQHPDGLDGDDIQAVLDRCYRRAAAWLPADRLRPRTIVAALAGALGVQEPGLTYDPVAGPPVPPEDWAGDPVGGHVFGAGRPPVRTEPDTGPQAGPHTGPAGAPTAAEYAWHAPLIIADLLVPARRPLRSYLDAAFAELARADTMEAP